VPVNRPWSRERERAQTVCVHLCVHAVNEVAASELIADLEKIGDVDFQNDADRGRIVDRIVDRAKSGRYRTPIGDAIFPPKNLWTEYRIRNNPDARWDYYVDKAGKYLRVLPLADFTPVPFVSFAERVRRLYAIEQDCLIPKVDADAIAYPTPQLSPESTTEVPPEDVRRPEVLAVTEPMLPRVRSYDEDAPVVIEIASTEQNSGQVSSLPSPGRSQLGEQGEG